MEVHQDSSFHDYLVIRDYQLEGIELVNFAIRAAFITKFL